MATKPIPDEYHAATPYLIMNNATKAIAFYKEAFGATEVIAFSMLLATQSDMQRSQSATRALC